MTFKIEALSRRRLNAIIKSTSDFGNCTSGKLKTIYRTHEQNIHEYFALTKDLQVLITLQICALFFFFFFFWIKACHRSHVNTQISLGAFFSKHAQLNGLKLQAK